ncbi:Tyrosine--tRNA ligase [Pyrenophora tritici-repentis]|nr:Tyrosine--tRNA ligase [Pyrenophora tritici-repentis]
MLNRRSGRKTLDWLLTEKRIGVYVGVDPTAPLVARRPPSPSHGALLDVPPRLLRRQLGEEAHDSMRNGS